MRGLDRDVGFLGRLASFFEGESRVLAAYLFGSYARGFQVSHSDVDIAVLLSEVPENLLDYYLDLSRRLSDVLGVDVDLVFLNFAPPLLWFQVLRYGRLLYSRDEAARIRFESRSLSEYLDLSIDLRRYDECFVRSVLEG